MKKFDGYMHGVGIGGWLTNYRRFTFIPPELRTVITKGDIQHFDTFITQKDIESIASWGVDHIRFAFDYLILEDEDKPFIYKESGYKYIDLCLDWCKKAGLNVIFDLHKAAGASCDFKSEVSLVDDRTLQKRFISLWCDITRRYLGEGDNIAFELLNEVNIEDCSQWNALVKKTIDAIRAIDKKRKIVVGGNHYNSITELKFLDVYDDENIVYTFHCYQPFEFTHQKAVIMSKIASFNRYFDYPSEITPYLEFCDFVKADKSHYNGFDRMDRKYLYYFLQPAVDFIKKHSKALYCGEFGVIRHADIKSRENYYRDVIAFCDEHGIAHSAWNYLTAPYDANRFSIVDDWDRKPLSEELIKIIS